MHISRLGTASFLALLMASVSACDGAAERGLRVKERCAQAAEREDARRRAAGIDSRVSEVFFSEVRNSCVCEATQQTVTDDGAMLNKRELVDCLTRQHLESEVIVVSNPKDLAAGLAKWRDKLKPYREVPSE